MDEIIKDKGESIPSGKTHTMKNWLTVNRLRRRLKSWSRE